ncbi:hypothetical protein MAIC_16760 [Mycolicibacterium aichiense]|uniref:Uncharacterized protein n=1 Tax=Mycolicibacterium aichiense TaxID=1799 RepID=A0AAD1MAW1_9MYCO|nr:hypothetical protein MAIC_16760 [Mycolicibacterium aichiense]STZ80690.1 Uncharacterised protein [Mycolicibacterium aichiense]
MTSNPGEDIRFVLGVAELRERLKLAGFRGSVRALSALGPLEHGDSLCAYIRCRQNDVHEVFINTGALCNHHHLTIDVMDLVNAYRSGKLDRGWNLLPNGDASTGVLTRGAAARAGISPSQCAPNPYRTTG